MFLRSKLIVASLPPLRSVSTIPDPVTVRAAFDDTQVLTSVEASAFATTVALGISTLYAFSFAIAKVSL